ncbi:MAG: Ig-like domain-containing protein, partial [Peptococcaceae bacterium]|nr:Ig-like domain-containing protein [Peptococcaceae bacterium]
MLTRYRRVTVEGARLLVGPWWDVRTRSWLPLYPDLIAHPRHTPAGRRVLLCLEDACTHAALDDSGYRDCGSCRYYRLQPRCPARHLRPPIPKRPASTCGASAAPASASLPAREGHGRSINNDNKGGNTMKPLHHKTHTIAKRFLSLLCILALCLGLLPATALAAEEIKLFIGGQQITESGCYEKNQDGDWTKVEDSDGTEPANGQFYYDAATFTLTLNEVEISYDGTLALGTKEYYGSVIAYSPSADVSLNIVVSQGTSTITGKGGIRVESTTGNASLSIKGPGSLNVEPKGSDSGITLYSSKNRNLDIDGADVTASSPDLYGVYLISSTDASSTSTITVNNGSLTTGGNGNVGIYYYWSGTSNAGTSSLTVSGNAVVDTRNSQILTNNEETGVQVGAGSDSNGGIVFNGKSGTVYGDVTLQEDLEIGTDETLTIGKDASLTVPDGKNLTNNGTVTTEEGGTLTGTISGNQPPKITTASLSDGTAGTAYNQTLLASGDATITWSSSDLPNWLTLNSDGTISGTPTAAGTSTFTVKAENTAGSDSKELTLTINPAPILVTGVTLEPTSLSLFTGDTATLSATVTPENATNKSLTWSSDNEAVATVDQNGTVTAVGAGKTTISVTTEDGGKTATCTVTVTDKTYAISADTTALNFGSAYTGYAQPAAKTVTLTNTGNQQVTVTLPTANDFIITAGTGFTDGSAAIKPGETATFTVQPKTGLSVGTYSDTITVSGSENVTVTIPASFTVKSRPSYNPPTVSEETTDAIADAQPGETVTVDLSHGSTKLDKEVFETLAGKDVTLVVDLSDGVSWTVNGTDIPADANLSDLDLGVEMDSDGIPVDVVNSITGERDTVQMTLAHDGAFGFTMTLTAPLGKENAGYWANLYHYDEDAEALNFEATAKIDEDGSVTIPFSHASQYAIVIDTHSHAT